MPQPTTSPLVGRQDELARLTGLLDRARAGEARAVLVAGDAGVGKTRLLDETAARAAADGMTVVTGRCVDLGDVGLPYLPFTEILGRLAADERFASVVAAHPLAERLVTGGPADEGSGREADARLRLFEDFTGLFADLAAAAPLLLVLEDLHWADQSTRDLLRFLLSRAVLQRTGGGSQRMALIASYRTDDLHRRHPLRPVLAELVRLPAVERLELRPLADTDVERLIRTLRPDPLPEATVRRIVERAEGNAFYAEELLAATADEGTAAGSAEVPSGLADVLLVRFEQLSGTAQEVLRAAAVAGRSVEHEVLRSVVELPAEELESALREATSRQLLVAGGLAGEGSGERDTYTFRHALIQETVYTDLLPGERVRLHRVFAQLPATRSRPAARAHHARESHDLPGALEASLEAADHAHRVGAPAEELRHLEAALDLWQAVDPAERPESAGLTEITLTLRASAAAAHAGENHRAVTLTRAALARVGSDADSELAARVHYTLAGRLMGIDSVAAAFTHSSEALAMIPPEPPTPTWVWAAATHVMAAGYTGDEDTARRVGEEALGKAKALGMTDAQADLTISLVGFGDFKRRTPEGREQLRHARDLARRAANDSIELRALFNLAIGSFESGALDECLTWLTEGLDRARSAGLLTAHYPLMLRYLRSLVLFTLGRWDECVEAARADADRMPAAGAFVTGPALYVALGRGEPGAEEGAQLLVEQPYDSMAWIIAGVVLTDGAAMRQDPEAAVGQVRATLARLTEDSDGDRHHIGIRLAALALSAVADAAAELRLTGDESGARKWTETAAELAGLARDTANVDEDSWFGPEGRAWLARAEAEESRAAGRADVDAWAKAVAAFAEYGDVYERARCERRLAEALLAADRRTEAAEHARTARETATALGARPLLEDIDALIRRGRLQAQAAPAESVLTSRERDVLLLLAQGMTNRRIGEELFISGKTASVHVSNILAKLGAASRTEAVGIAYREGLIEESTAS
ncbi:helix-turn-helix transcriptional regulator [Streptomyces indicus]|uniref:Regulatory protein, luxR family n=1 Tax=Streptomyces indicus TaxID=417292 RepID=A0A1G8ZUE8_9ACTN|nr:helix-turn-helix transcriptional regulator [Streptomyces indicus]SDK18631.1 regulatory protein, luxR family [Streptomyces indicus]